VSSDDLLYESMPPGGPVVFWLNLRERPQRLRHVYVSTDPDLAPEGYMDALLEEMATWPDAGQ
jgi:hypothetical protein